MSGALPADLQQWLAENTEGIDLGSVPAEGILPRLTSAGLSRIGIPSHLGGTGGGAAEMVQAVAAVARESLTAAFILWSHRNYAEFLVHTENSALRDQQLPDILAGHLAGASGLSNAMKSLAGLEPMQIKARADRDALIADGKLPWVTNLRPAGFHVAVAADRVEGGPALVIALSHDDPGLARSNDLALMAMRSSDTAAVNLSGVRIPAARILAENAQTWLAALRPSFIALQCGMAIGLARRALDEAEASSGSGRAILGRDLTLLREQLSGATKELSTGLRDNRFACHPARLFELRICFSDIVASALLLELQAGGGRCYLREPGRDFARRWREAAFVPLITPSIVQLRSALETASKAA